MDQENQPVIKPTEQTEHRWRNLYFVAGGRFYWGTGIWETESDCWVISIGWFAEIRALLAAGDYEAIEWDGDLVPPEDVLFAIPMPWKGAAL